MLPIDLILIINFIKSYALTLINLNDSFIRFLIFTYKTMAKDEPNKKGKEDKRLEASSRLPPLEEPIVLENVLDTLAEKIPNLNYPENGTTPEKIYCLRVAMLYLAFDIEATRRENTYLRKMLEREDPPKKDFY